MAGRGNVGLRGSASSVGMMEGAFFVGRTELLAWVNALLQINLAKVEQCASGAVYCQVLDACHPGTVSMKKVNWMAKVDHEFIPNYKVLQAAFDKNGIQRHVAVDMLIRAKYQDNLEFMQFMKCYWEHEASGEYNPVPAREGKPMPPWARGGAPADPNRSLLSEKENQRPKPPARSASGEGDLAAKRPGSGKPTPTGPAAKAAAGGASLPRPASRGGQPQGGGAGTAALTAEVEAARIKLAAQDEEMEDLRNTVEGLEHERDYYFRKLREVEILCSALQVQLKPPTPEDGDEAVVPPAAPPLDAVKIVQDVQDILYAENDVEDQKIGGELPDGTG